jgi:hypothetical protein
MTTIRQWLKYLRKCNVPIGMVTVILTIRISYRYSGTYTSTNEELIKVGTAAVNNTFSLYYLKTEWNQPTEL